MRKKLRKFLAGMLLGGFVLCNLGFNVLQVLGEQVPTVIETDPAIKDCIPKLNLFGENPRLEDSGWWNKSHNWNCGAYSLDTAVKRSGQSSLKYSEATANWDNTLFAPDIPVKPNTEYTFTFWIRGDVQGDAFASLLYGQTKIGNVEFRPPSFDGKWYQVGFTFNSGDITSVRLYIGSGGGTLYFDDFQLFEKGATYIITTQPEYLDALPGKNLFENPGFENGDDWWKHSHNWSISEYSLVSDQKHSGQYSLKYSAPAANWDNGLFAPDFTVKPYTDYTFSFWIKGEVQGDVFGCILTGNDKIGGEVVLKPPAFDGNWYQVGYTFNTGKHNKIRFTIGPGGGTAYFDDFQLFEISDADIPERDPYIVTLEPVSLNAGPEYNLFGNPGFEDGDAWWKDSYNWELENYSIVDYEKFSGNYSLKYSMDHADWDRGLFTKNMPVKKNTNYTFSFWIKGEVQGDVFGCMLNGNDKIGGEIVLKPPAFDGKWYQVGYTFNTGKTDNVRFTIGPGGGTAYFDDFQLFETFVADPPVQRETSIVTMNPESLECKDEDNLLGDKAGFETDEWWKSGSNWNAGVYSLAADEKHSGGYSLKYSDSSANWDVSYASPTITVKPNTNYTFSLWMMGKSRGDVFICVIAGGNKVGGEYYLVPKDWNGTWNQVGYTFNTGKYTEVRIYIGPGGGTVYFDDLKLFETSKALPPPENESRIVTMNPEAIDCADEDNLLRDYSGFESDEWWKDGSNWNSGLYKRVQDTKHSGEYSLRYSDTKADWDNSYGSPRISVKPDTDYTFSVWIKGEIQGDGFICMIQVGPSGDRKVGGEYYLVPKRWDGNWYQVAYTFNTGKYKELRICIGPGGGTIYFDDLKLFEASKGFVPPAKEGNDPSGRRAVYHNITTEDKNNLITDPGCEDSNYWSSNAANYGTALSVSSDKPYKGNGGLKFAANGASSYIKWFDLEKDTDYYVSLMVCADPEILGDIKWFMIDSQTNEIENKFTQEEAGNYVLRGGVDSVFHVPSWDGYWYNRIFRFNTGRETRVGLKITGTKGTLYFDEIKLFKASDAITIRETDTPAVLDEVNPEKSICADEDNLVQNGNFDNGSQYWNEVTGFGKFVSVRELVGNKTLYYKGTDSHAYYIAWFNVKPNTKYTLSFYTSVIKPGAGEAGVLDSSLDREIVGTGQIFSEVKGWQHYAISFITEELDKVAFYVYDGGGEAAIDKIRLFEADKGIAPDESDIPPVIPVDKGDNGKSPQTGDNTAWMTATAAMLASSGAVVTARRKRNRKNRIK